MGQALYRKYRSKSLDEIVGQSHVTLILKRAIASGNVAHAYLLTGTRGVGKTSIARILAHEINHLPYTDESTHLDIIEIDAASNNSVEDIRTLREKVQIAPAQAEKKVYIIDEVHMLSKSAFNALLKTLEEPPAHVVFILATTDVEKLPSTIISRVQRFNLRAISPEDAVMHLRTIADGEHIDIDDGALGLIALHGRGSFRDSISLLDQLQNISDGRITTELVQNVLGLVENETVERILTAYQSGDIAAIVSLLNTAEAQGTPATVVAEQLIHTIRPRVVAQPELLTLLDRLLEISKSAWPHIKLLTALTSRIAASTSSPLVTTHFDKNANAKANDSTSISEGFALPEKSRQERKQDQVASAQPEERGSGGASEELPKTKDGGPESEETNAPDVAPTTNNGETSASFDFPWDDFLAKVKEHSAGAYTLLTKCGYVFTGTQLKIYAGRKFNKTKLDKNIAELSAAMQSVGVRDGSVEITDQPAPPKDSQTAAILDIMGGGQEVNL